MTQTDSWWQTPSTDGNKPRRRGVDNRGGREDARPAQLALEGKARPLTVKASRHAPLLRYTQRDMAVVAAIHAHGGVLTTVQIAQKFWPPDVKRKLQGLGISAEHADEIITMSGEATVNQYIDQYRWLCRVHGLLTMANPPAAQTRSAEWLKTLYQNERRDFHELSAAARQATTSDGKVYVLGRLGRGDGVHSQAGSGGASTTTQARDGQEAGIITRLYKARPQLPSETVSSACKARLNALVRQGILEAWEQPVRLREGRAQSCWFLTRDGRNLLAGWMGVKAVTLPYHPPGSYGTLHLGHRLALNDFRIALESGAEHKGYQVTRWIDDNDLKRMLAKEKVTLRRMVQDSMGTREDEEKYSLRIPDGYFVLDLGNGVTHHCFVELDNQTLTLAYSGDSTKDYAHKVRTMAAFYRSGRYQRIFPEAGDSMWYLTVTTGGEKRLANLQATTERVMGAGNRAADRYWFARMDDIPTWQEPFSTEVFTPIWLRAGQGRKWSLDE